MRVLPLIALLSMSTESLVAQSDKSAFELTFRFNQPGGSPSEHSFVLRWANADSNLQSILVQESETGKTVQTITVPQDQVQIRWRDLVAGNKSTRDKIIDYLDFNFDQYGDIRLTKKWPYKLGQKKYLVWLFDKVENTYKLAEDISRLAAPVPDARVGLIHSTEPGAYGGGEFVSDSYSVGPDGDLTLETRITQTVKDAAHLKFMREVQAMNLSRPRVICRIEVPAEGKPKTVWGLPDTCDAFMVKTAPLGIPAAPAAAEEEAEPSEPATPEKPQSTPKAKPKAEPVAH